MEHEVREGGDELVTGKHRIAAVIWRYHAAPKGVLRRIERRVFRNAYGKRLTVPSSVHIANPRGFGLHESGQLRIGERTIIETDSALNIEGDCSIGSDCYISIRLTLGCSERIQIGNRVAIGPNVCIFDTNKRYDDTSRPIVGQGKSERPVIIGDDCWVGAGVVILAGANIGKHSVIAAGAVVSEAVPPNSLVGGVPGKVLRRIGNGTHQ